MWWERTKFVIEHIKAIVIAGAVLWTLVIFTLDLTGLIDIQADSPTLGALIEKIIDHLFPAAIASPLDHHSTTDRGALIRVRIVLLPNL